MSGQKDSGAKKNGGAPEKKDDRKALKQAQQKAEKKARIAAVKEERKKNEEEKTKDEAGPSHRFLPLPHSLETSPQYTSDSEEDNLLLIAAEFLKKPETSNNNSQEPRPSGRFTGGYTEEVEDDLDAGIVIRTAYYEDPNAGKEYPERSQTEIELADFMARVDDEIAAEASEEPEQAVEAGPESSNTTQTKEDKEEAARKNKSERRKKRNLNKRLAKEMEKQQQRASENGDGPSQENGTAEIPTDTRTETPAELSTEEQQTSELPAAAPAAQGEPAAPEVLATQAVSPDGGDEHKGNPKKKKNKKKKEDDEKANKAEKTADEKYKELFGDDYETPKNSKGAGHSKNNNAKQKVEKKEKKAPMKKENSVAKEEPIPVEKTEKVNQVEKPPVTQKTENNVLDQAVKKLEQLELELPEEEYSSSSENEFTLVTNRKKKAADSGSSSNVSLASKSSPVVQENGAGSPRAYDNHYQQHGPNNQPYRRTYYSRTWKGRDAPHFPQQKPQYNKKAGPTPQMSQQEFPPLPHQNAQKQAAQPVHQPATTSVWNKQKEQRAQSVNDAKTPWSGNHSPTVNGGKAAEVRDTPPVEKETTVMKKEEPAGRLTEKFENTAVETPREDGGKKDNYKKSEYQKQQRAWKQYPKNDQAPFPPVVHQPPVSLHQPPVAMYNGTVITAAPPMGYKPYSEGNPVPRARPAPPFSYFDINIYKEEKERRNVGEIPPDPIYYTNGSRRSVANDRLSNQDWADLLTAKYNPNVHNLFMHLQIQYVVGTGIAGTGLMDVEDRRRTPMVDHSMTYSNIVGQKYFHIHLKLEQSLIHLESIDGNGDWPLKNEQSEIVHAKDALIEQAYKDASLLEFEKELLSAILEYDGAKIADILQRELPDMLPEGTPYRYTNVINKIMSYTEKQNGITVFHLICASKTREQCRVVEFLFSHVPAEKVTSWLNVTDYTAHRNGVHFAAINGYSFIIETLFPYLGNSNLNRRDSTSCTPMDYGVQRNSIETVRLLQWAGADLAIGPYVTVKNDSTAYVELRQEAMTNAVGAYIRNAYKNIFHFQEPATQVQFVKFEAGHQGRIQFEIPLHFFDVSEEDPTYYKANSLFLAVQPIKYTCMDFEMPGKSPHVVEMNLPKRIAILTEVKVTDKGHSQFLTHFMCQKSGYAFKIPALCSDKPLVTFKMDPKLEISPDKGENLLLAMQLYVASPQMIQEEVQQPIMHHQMNPAAFLPQAFVPAIMPNYQYGPYQGPIIQQFGAPPPITHTFAQNYPVPVIPVYLHQTPNLAYPPPPAPFNNNPTGKFPPVKQHPH